MVSDQGGECAGSAQGANRKGPPVLRPASCGDWSATVRSPDCYLPDYSHGQRVTRRAHGTIFQGEDATDCGVCVSTSAACQAIVSTFVSTSRDGAAVSGPVLRIQL